MSDRDVLAAGTVLAARYRIVSLVGRGGMGAVYRAQDLRLPTATWAVKELWDGVVGDKGTETAPLTEGDEPPESANVARGDMDVEARQLFEREAMLLAGLAHPGLPHVSDYFTENGRQYLVMEFIEGETLQALVERNGPPLVADAVRWALQMCDAVAYLHGRPQPIIFRDVKPSNVMLTGTGAIKIVDFGIARIYSAARAADTVALGTPGYAAPEQYGRHGQSDARTDVYGLGATLHFVLTARDPSNTPFHFDPPSRVNPNVPPALDAIVLRAVAVDAADRFGRVSELASALESVQRASVGAAVPASSPLSPTAALPQPASTVTTPRFEACRLSFGRVRRGETRRINVRILGEVDGLLVSSAHKWLRADPRRVRGRDPITQIVLYSGRLHEGRDHHAIVTLRTRGGETQLPVSVDVEPARLTLFGVVLAALFTAGSMLPVVGLLSALFYVALYYTCPLDERPALRPFGLATGFFAACNLALLLAALVAVHFMPHLWQWMRSWFP